MGLRAYHNMEFLSVPAAQSRGRAAMGGGYRVRHLGAGAGCARGGDVETQGSNAGVVLRSFTSSASRVIVGAVCKAVGDHYSQSDGRMRLWCVRELDSRICSGTRPAITRREAAQECSESDPAPKGAQDQFSSTL